MTNILYSVFKPVEKPYSCNSVNLYLYTPPRTY